MVDDDLGNLPHHGKICQPRTMAAMAIFGRILQPHQLEPLNRTPGMGKYLALLFDKLCDIVHNFAA